MDAILPAPEAEVQAAAEQIGLVAGFAVEGDDAAFGHGAAARPEFLDDADLLVGDVAHRQPDEQQQNGRDDQRLEKYVPGKGGRSRAQLRRRRTTRAA